MMSRYLGIFLLTGCLLVTVSDAFAQQFKAQFDPANGIVPNPVNLLFQGSVDGTLNIPNPNNVSVISALNALDGFSTVAPMTTLFSAALDPASIEAGVSVRLFEVDLINPFEQPAAGSPFAVQGVKAELVGGQDFAASVLAEDPEQRTLVITPLRPLQPKTGYMVVLTQAIRSASGARAMPDTTYIFARHRRALVDSQGRSQFARLSDEQAQSLEGIRRVVVSEVAAAGAAGVRKGHIILSWSFMTQSVGDTLLAAKASGFPQVLELATTGLTTASLNPLLPGIVDIYAGTLQVPYYLEAPTLIPSVILSTQWQGINGTHLTRYNPAPVATQTLTVPVLAAVPNTMARPAAGWPVVIFQHGITRNRTDLLAVADTLASAGFMAVAIDLPLHGITSVEHPFYQDGRERTFNVDLINNTTGAAGADGLIDSSGSHMINLSSLLTGRDNLRQSVVDLLALAASLPDLDLDRDGMADIDSSRVHFWGHSLGGITGISFLALEDTLVDTAVLTAAGGGIAKLLQGSADLGPVIEAGLAAVGLVAGTPEFEAFFRAAQQVIDAGDSANYAAEAAAGHPVYLAEIVGPPSDSVIPNSVSDAPLSGTEPLAAIMGLRTVTDTLSDAGGIRAISRFNAGDHGSPMGSPAAPAVTHEIHWQAGGFLQSGGTVLPVNNISVLVPQN